MPECGVLSVWSTQCSELRAPDAVFLFVMTRPGAKPVPPDDRAHLRTSAPRASGLPGQTDRALPEVLPRIFVPGAFFERADREASGIESGRDLIPGQWGRHRSVRTTAHRVRRDDRLHVAVAKWIRVH